MTAAIPERLRLQPLEIACGEIFGRDTEAPPLPRGVTMTARQAFEAAVRPALSRTPCLVSFSGGRDSSAVLATAVAVARRDGLALPVPVTYRFPDAPGSDETAWQEQVVRHLGLSDWEQVTMSSELDTVGPVAQRVLGRHGVLWPFNVHFHLPLLERASGGALLTGAGGDELLGGSRWAVAERLLSRRLKPRPVHLRTLGLAFSPRPVKAAVIARRDSTRWPWLRPEVELMVRRRRAAWYAQAPVGWHRTRGWWWGGRYRGAIVAGLGALATDAGALVVHPFMDPLVVAATIGRFGSAGPLGRAAALEEMFSDVLPAETVRRRSKAFFDEAFIAEHTRRFARDWAGHGVDLTLIDPDRLAAEWQAPRPDGRTFLLMQAAWLAQRLESIRPRGGNTEAGL